jgi:DNA-binding NarL/FixJ family response regulator
MNTEWIQNELRAGALHYILAYAPDPPTLLNEMEDIIQSAWVAYLENPEDRPPFRVGINTAARIKERLHHKAKAEDLAGRVAHEHRRSQGLPTLNQLTEIFLNARQKKGERGAKAARQDAKIIILAATGNSDAYIARELGLSEKSIPRLRLNARRVLTRVGHSDTMSPSLNHT